jgi:hypothetical protein
MKKNKWRYGKGILYNLFISGIFFSSMLIVVCNNYSYAGNLQDDNKPQQQNVLLLISDDHGIDQLGCFGNDNNKTPNLDQLAEQGVRFTNAYRFKSLKNKRLLHYSGLSSKMDLSFKDYLLLKCIERKWPL